MPWVAGAAVIGAVGQNMAANKAANAQKSAANAANAQLEQNYNRTSQNLTPYIGAGSNALTGLNALANGNYSGFENSPDYQAALNLGLQGLDRSAAAKGSLYSGGQSADVVNYASQLASQNLNNYRNSLMSLAQMGEGAASNLGSVGTGNAASIGSNLTSAGNAAANGYYNTANANSNLLGQLANFAGQYQSSYTPQVDTTNTYYGSAPTFSASDLTF